MDLDSEVSGKLHQIEGVELVLKLEHLFSYLSQCSNLIHLLFRDPSLQFVPKQEHLT